jgi:AraC-like DNA-binding protein
MESLSMITPAAEILRYLAGSHVLLALALLVRDYRRERTARVTAGFLITLLGYLASPVLVHHRIEGVWTEPVFVAAYAVPFAFWLLARSHFEDGFRITPHGWFYFAALLGAHYGARGGGSTAWALLPRVLGAALVLDALYRVYSGARSDLLEHRLRLRYLFLAVSGLYVLAVLFGESVLFRTPVALIADALNAALVYLTIFSFSFLFSSLGGGLLRPKEKRFPAASPALVEKLRRLVEEEKVYREPGLTIGKLAKRLGQAEHVLRRAINAELGYKNFNAFLHHYRVRDALAALEDPQDERTVAEIAYELGYQSLGPFNKVFKELTGRTPSEVRNTRN